MAHLQNDPSVILFRLSVKHDEMILIECCLISHTDLGLFSDPEGRTHKEEL